MFYPQTWKKWTFSMFFHFCKEWFLQILISKSQSNFTAAKGFLPIIWTILLFIFVVLLFRISIVSTYYLLYLHCTTRLFFFFLNDYHVKNKQYIFVKLFSGHACSVCVCVRLHICVSDSTFVGCCLLSYNCLARHCECWKLKEPPGETRLSRPSLSSSAGWVVSSLSGSPLAAHF